MSGIQLSQSTANLAIVFGTLKRILEFKRTCFSFMEDKLDHDICLLIGDAQAQGQPINLTYITTAGLGAFSTVMRHLKRLEELGVVEKERASRDRRNVQYRLADWVLLQYREYIDIWHEGVASARTTPMRQSVDAN